MDVTTAFEHFVYDGIGAYVGKHAIIELWGIVNHKDENEIKQSFISAAEAIGAKVLFSHIHPFGPEAGTTGVIVLSESHISWHHYCECSYLAVDIFVCGNLDPSNGFDVIKEFWKPAKFESKILQRGLVECRNTHFEKYLSL